MGGGVNVGTHINLIVGLGPRDSENDLREDKVPYMKRERLRYTSLVGLTNLHTHL